MYKWLKRHCFLSSKGGKKPKNVPCWTHTLYSGGTFYVDDESYNEFLKMFSFEIENNKDEILTINEKGTDIFKLYQDLDYEMDHEMTDDEIYEHVKYMQECIKLFYQDYIKQLSEDDEKIIFSAYILSSPTKELKNGKIKNGYHIIWPFIRVDRDKALFMYHYIVRSLYNKFGIIMEHKKSEFGGWENALDEMVYQRNALRMPFAYKTIGCCYDKECEKCKGKNKIIEKRSYKLKFIIDGKGTMEYKNLSILKVLKLCSIRLAKNKQIITPMWKNISQLTYMDIYREKNVTSDINLTYEWKQLLNGIRNTKVYQSISIKSKIKKKIFSNGSKCFFINVDGKGSKFCHNVMRCHTTAGIYFMVTINGVYQKCYCPCKTHHNRKDNIPCSKYKFRIEVDDNIIKNIYKNDTNDYKVDFDDIDDDIFFSLDDYSNTSQDTSISYNSEINNENNFYNIDDKINTIDNLIFNDNSNIVIDTLNQSLEYYLENSNNISIKNNQINIDNNKNKKVIEEIKNDYENMNHNSHKIRKINEDISIKIYS